MLDVKKIEIILENCESIDITNAVGDFYINDISSTIKRVAINAISKVLYANEVFIQLYKKGKFEFHSFDNTNDPIARLKNAKDITAIEITYTNNNSEIYYVDYKDEDEDCWFSENINQKNLETEKSFYILISSTKTFDDIEIDEVEDIFLFNYE